MRRRSWASAAVAAIITLELLMVTSPAHASVPSDPSMGLMIQVSTLAPSTSPATLRSWLEDVRRDHHRSDRPGYINTVVLQDIADPAGALYTRYLDVLAPYLPGGATPLFTRAFVGTVDLAWTGAGSKYLQGIESSTFRARNVAVSLAAARAFHARYPSVINSWYVTYEANLAGFWNSTLVAAYRSYLTGVIGALSGVETNRGVLWSPAFWTMYGNEPAWAMPGLRANLAGLFAALPVRLVLSVQDFVGQSDGRSTAESAANWVGFLQRNCATHLAGVQINVEQFSESADGNLTAGSAAGVPAREAYYRARGITLGAAAEIRYWHARLYGAAR